MRVDDIAALLAHDARQREGGARDEDRIEVGDVEPDELGAGLGNLVLEPAAVRRDDHAMAAAAQDAHQIDRARIRRARMQRRRDDKHGERPRKRDDFAGRLLAMRWEFR